MANLIETTSRKSDWQIEEEKRIARAKAGHASFTKSFADMAGNVVETGPRAAAGFVSGLGGVTNAPTVARQKIAQKADVLATLPQNAKGAAKTWDAGTQAFIALVYDRFAQTGEHLSFTATDAAKVMGKTTEQARATVEALARSGLLAPAYSSMGTLAGYKPGITN